MSNFNSPASEQDSAMEFSLKQVPDQLANQLASWTA